MVAETVRLPNLRKMFVPSVGYTMIEADLERADAHVVAWEAGAERLKSIFRAREDIHSENAKVIFRTSKPTGLQRFKAKKGVHLVDYLGGPDRLASAINVTRREADDFIKAWFGANPEIPEWHRRVEALLQTEREVSNIWGFRRHYFDRIDALLPKAVAWIGQSTVAITINKALTNIDASVEKCQLLLQDHDSLLMQCLSEHIPSIYSKIERAMTIRIPFPDPLIIPVKLSSSPVSWGDCKEVAREAAQRLDSGLLAVHAAQ